MISIDSLCVDYPGHRVLDSVSLEAGDGKVTTILGPNGSGKSTILKAVTGMLQPAAGSIRLNGRALSTFSRKEVARNLCLVSQRHEAPADVSVRELVGFGRHPHHRWFSALNAADHRIIDEAIEQTGLQDLRERNLATLSGGEAQKAWIAMALAQRPQILLLDEPTTYLDIAHQLDVLELVARINREQGLSVVMVLHDLNHASSYSDDLVVLHRGRVACSGTPREILTHQTLASVYQVHAEISDGPAGRRIHPVARL